jgi:hypothetical protein
MNPKPATVLEGLNYLPGFFRSEIEREDAFDSHPVRWLLQTFEHNLHEVEYFIENSGTLADPFASFDSFASFAPGLERNRLDWLAAWLALDLDPDWFAEPATAERNRLERFPKARQVLAQIARLYARRGTPEGLKKMIRLFFELEVEICENCWLGGMEIGEHSTIGVDTWLADQPEPALDLVILIRHKQPRLASFNNNRIPCRIEGPGKTRGGECLWSGGLPDTEEEPARLERAPHEALFAKLQAFVEREKPAHLHCYLALDSVSAPETKSTTVPPMIIEKSSEIGNCAILSEKEGE